MKALGDSFKLVQPTARFRVRSSNLELERRLALQEPIIFESGSARFVARRPRSSSPTQSTNATQAIQTNAFLQSFYLERFCLFHKQRTHKIY